ncbi:MAG: Gfo/Idh/MocA family oxidoreductase [Planctomycetes bacterium]|nr:Gfo/Idh/MocA family oxidoreductase [Planctomycetota bacterium]
MPSGPSRRDFLVGAAGAASLASLPGRAPAAFKHRSPNARLRIAQIGCGGKGLSDMQACAQNHDIVALCDVDDGKAANARNEQAKATFYHDWRDLLDREKLDAVVISTPDHMHAIPALCAMQLGLHVFVQKPLVHTVEEARALLAASKKFKVVTSMGNQGTCLPGFREAAEVVRSGAIGQVTEVHVWTDRPENGKVSFWSQGIERPKHIDAIPATFRWDLWLGAAAYRPFAGPRKDTPFRGYAPFHWRGFWDFGTGAIGDMACHVANLPYFALELGSPEWVEAESSGVNDETGPKQSTIRCQFPANGKRGKVLFTWYDGGRVPPQDLLPGVVWRGGGFLLKGTEGTLYSPTDYGESYDLYPKEKFADYKKPDPTLPRVDGIHAEWLDCIATGKQPMASFDYAAPFTEAMLLGNVALRVGKRIAWDPAAMRCPGTPEADRFLRKEYRREFQLPRV